MADETDFEVKLGRIRSPSGARKVERLFKRISSGAQGYARTGGRRGDGQRRTTRAQFHRRVIAKASIKRMNGSTAALKKHLNYIERDGTDRSGDPARLYGPDHGGIDRDEFLERAKGDRHHFRFIISPEDAGELKCLSAFTRDLVRQMEADLGTRLEWVAADHYDTGQPHTHLIIRGRRNDGRDLVMQRDYIAHGIRRRAQDLVDLELGPVSEIDGRARFARMVSQDRFTALDRTLFEAADDGALNIKDLQGREHWRLQLARRRLRHLQMLDLAEPRGKGEWRLKADAEEMLQRLGARGDIVKTMHQALAAKNLGRPINAASLYDPAADDARPVTGAVIDYGVADDVNDRAYVVIDSLDGRPVYAEIGGEDDLTALQRGRVVSVSPANRNPKRADQVIAEIAHKNTGRYSPRLHLKTDKSARPAFVEAHVRRLEALRRAGHVKRTTDGVWRVPHDYLDRVRQFERAVATRRPAELRLHGTLTLAEMKSAIGATWLDEHLLNGRSDADARGFGGDVQTASAARLRFLTREGFLEVGADRTTRATLDALQIRDLDWASDEVSAELGKPYTRAPARGKVSGLYTQAVDRPSGRFAIIERSKDFTLVPWRDVMERNLGKQVTGMIRANGVDWRLGKGRGIT